MARSLFCHYFRRPAGFSNSLVLFQRPDLLIELLPWHGYFKTFPRVNISPVDIDGKFSKHCNIPPTYLRIKVSGNLNQTYLPPKSNILPPDTSKFRADLLRLVSVLEVLRRFFYISVLELITFRLSSIPSSIPSLFKTSANLFLDTHHLLPSS